MAESFYKYKKTVKSKLVSAIVPVFNEEKTVAKVVKTLLESDLVYEVISVNDGSTDRSLSILREFKNKIKLVDLKKNRGKGFALAAGIKAAKGGIVIFVDADLTTFSDDHIKALLKPIFSKSEIRAVLGYPTSKWYMPNIFSSLTGERAYYRKDLIPHLKRMEKTRFGVEFFLNHLFDKKETKKVPLKNLVGLYKHEKRDSANAFKEYLGEVVEIALEIGRIEGLLPEDKQIIDNLVSSTNFKELSMKIKKIHSAQVKQFLNKYVLRYVKKSQKHRSKNCLRMD